MIQIEKFALRHAASAGEVLGRYEGIAGARGHDFARVQPAFVYNAPIAADGSSAATGASALDDIPAARISRQGSRIARLGRINTLKMKGIIRCR